MSLIVSSLLVYLTFAAAGDKVETAISIAYSCRLFTDDMGIIELREQEFHVGDSEAAVVQVRPKP